MTVNNNAAPFPRLRTAYLRAIARAWNDPEYLALLVAESHKGPRGALPFLEREYDFVFPFNVRLVLSVDPKKRPLWAPVATTGWYGFGDEYKIYLPKAPSVEQSAAVLGAYCAAFPSLLGAATDGVSVAPPEFGAFGVVTARIAALAWRPEAEPFRKELYTSMDSRVLIQDAMDCLIPWNFSIIVREAHGESSTDPAYWKSFPFSEIVLHVPSRPELDQQAVALGSYNATGSQYPFSC